MPLSDYIDEQNSSKENGNSGLSQIAADIWAAGCSAANKAVNFVAEHPLETAGTVAVAAGAIYLSRGRIANWLKPAALGSEAAIGTEALLSRGLPINSAVRGAMLNPEIAALAPGARAAAVRDLAAATDALVHSGLPISPAVRGAMLNPEIATLAPGARATAVREIAATNSPYFGFNLQADVGPYLAPAVRDLAPATDVLVRSGLPITPAIRGAMQNPQILTLRPAARLAALRDLGAGI